MRLSRNKVRFRKRISFLHAIVPSNSSLVLLLLLQFMFLLFGVEAGEVITSLSASSFKNTNSLLPFNLAAFMVIYSAIPHFATTKSIRNGMEVEDDEKSISNTSATTTLPSIVPTTIADLSSLSPSSLAVSSSSAEHGNSTSAQVSSRTLLVEQSNENATSTTFTPSEEMEMHLDSSEEQRKKRKERGKGMNRLKRQMGMAAEIALIAPALQTMGCIPKFVCGLNSKPPTQESSVMNDLAYLIKFAMLDDDDLDDPIFAEKETNTRGKDGLTRVKEDLIIENMAEEELIQDDPANLPFVWSDMEHRIKTKTRPGNKFRVEDVMDEIIVEPEQTAVGSLFTGLKSVLRIGRKRRSLEDAVGQGNETSQATGRSRPQMRDAQFFRRTLRWQQRYKKQPFWTTPQFRQDMELAERIGKIEQDEGKCSTTFSVCPYTTHEMMDIVHGGYKKKQMKKKKQQNRPQWYVNSQGPPPESSEETEEQSKRKPFYDPENLVTTTTPKTKWYPNDPENQIYYSIFPHKAVEQGLTTVPTTTRRPHVVVDDEEQPEMAYDIGPRPMKEHRKPPINVQGHVEYENDEGSYEGKKPEHLDVMMHNQNNHQIREPLRKQSWWSLGGGGKRRPQRPPHPQHPHNAHEPGRRPPHPGMGEPHQHSNPNDSGGVSREESNKSGNNDEDEHESSSEEQVKRKRKKKNKGGGSASESVEEDEDNVSSEEKTGRDEGTPSTTPAPPRQAQPATSVQYQLPKEFQGDNPNFQIISIEPIESVGDLVPTGVPQQYQSLQPLQPFFQGDKPKQQPIALPRPKYTIQKEKKRNKRRRFNQPSPAPVNYGSQQQHQQQHHVQPHQVPQTSKPDKKEDKSDEASEEDEEDEEKSQENSSEEKSTRDTQSPPPPPSQQQGRPHLNVILHGRPSEELREPPNQHRHKRPHPGNADGNQPQTSASTEDELDNSDEDNRNSNSAGVEPNSNELSREMANLPQPARAPPHHFRLNSSSEYTYSDENHGRPSDPSRPINYSYFKKGQREEHNGGPPPQPSPQQQQGQHQTHPPSTTQKYSTGFMSFLFGKKKQKRPVQGNMRPHHHQQQQQHSPTPNNSDEDVNDDDDDDIDDSRSSEERDTQPTFTAPEGKYEIGHLSNQLPPKSITPNFSPPERPQRPFRGSTSMEDSDEKRGRSTPPPPTTQQTTVAPTRPLVVFGNSHKFVIPAPAIPPQRSPTSPAPTPPSTKELTKDSEEDPESDEQKASEESKEDEEENSSEESEKQQSSKIKATSSPSKGDLHKKTAKYNDSVPVPPIANFHSGSATAAVPSATARPQDIESSTKNRADYGGGGDTSDEKQADEDSNQTKEDDSAEEDVKISKEDSYEDGSSEEQKKKKQPAPPPKRRPEDDELDHPSAQFPPQPPVGGDITAVEQILGASSHKNENDEDYPEPYSLAEDIPAAPPLQAVGFAPSLEILVPTNAPLKVPPGVPLTEFYQGNNPVAAPGGGPPGPGQQLAPVNPTSLLGLAQQAGATNNNNPPGALNPGGAPSQQAQQGIRNPGSGQTSNRGPGSNNRRPGQGQQSNRQPQQGNNQQQGGKEDSEENSSEENKNKTGEESSEEEKESKGNDGGFDEAILSVGQTGSEDEDDDMPEKDVDKGPPSPPPIFTGSAEQKLELQKNRPFLPRPITPRPPVYVRPKPGRREPILKHQLKPTQLLQLHHPQQIHPPQMKNSSPHHQHSSPQQQYSHFVLPMRPSAAANLNSLAQQQRPPSVTQSFSVSHLLRPLLPRPLVKTRKPLDPKVVQWIKESYGIPDLNDMQGPNRSGLQSEYATKTTTTKSPSKSKDSKKAEKPERKEVKVSPSKRKTTTVKPKRRGSAESRASDEVTSPTTTSTTTKPTTISTKPPPTIPSTTTAKSRPPSLAPPKATMSTTTTTTTTTAKLETKKPSSATTTKPSSTTTPSNKKFSPDYISAYDEAEMAQALFGSSEEEVEEEEKDSSEEDEEEEATTKKFKSKIKTKVAGQRLVITVKSVVNKTKTGSVSTSSERGKITSREKISKLGKYPTKYSSSEKKKTFVPSSSKEKIRKSPKETSSEENKRKRVVKSKSSEVENRKTSSSGEHQKRKSSESTAKSKSKHSSSASAEVKQIIANFGRSTSRPKPKPIKLPPIYGRHSLTHRRTG